MTETIKELLQKVWIKRNGEIDESMVSYCLKNTTYLNMGSYHLSLADKPSMDKTIYYADTDYGTGKMAKDPGTSFEVFRSHNIRMNSPKDRIEKIEENSEQITIHTKYNQRDTQNKIKGWTTKRWSEELRNNGRIATEEERQVILEGLKIELAKYEKRLATYFKRYGKHITTSSYWAER